MKSVLVPLADGFEEIEAITIIDILRRAGAEVTTAGLKKRNVKGSHGIKLIADSVLDEKWDKDWDMVVLPGGAHAPSLANDHRVLEILRNTAKAERYTTAICAAPYVMEKAGITAGKKVTSHPNWAEKMESAIHTGARVVVDGKIITGQAAGSAMEFAFKLVEVLYGKEKAEEVNQGVIARL